MPADVAAVAPDAALVAADAVVPAEGDDVDDIVADPMIRLFPIPLLLELLPQMLLLLLATEEVEEQPDDDEFDCAKLWILFVVYNAPPPFPNCGKLPPTVKDDVDAEAEDAAAPPNKFRATEELLKFRDAAAEE